MKVDSRYNKYGEIVHKISGLVPSVIAEREDVCRQNVSRWPALSDAQGHALRSSLK